MTRLRTGSIAAIVLAAGIALATAPTFAHSTQKGYRGTPVPTAVGHQTPAEIAAAAAAAAQAANAAALACIRLHGENAPACQAKISEALKLEAQAVAAARAAGITPPVFTALPSTGAGGMAGVQGSAGTQASVSTVPLSPKVGTAAGTVRNAAPSNGGISSLPATGGAAH